MLDQSPYTSTVGFGDSSAIERQHNFELRSVTPLCIVGVSRRNVPIMGYFVALPSKVCRGSHHLRTASTACQFDNEPRPLPSVALWAVILLGMRRPLRSRVSKLHR
jgi:hypothetical protein